MNENYACLSGRHSWAAAPARAREILDCGFKSDALGGVVVGSSASENEARIAELKRRVQEGTYRVNTDELCARIINEHIES